MTTTTILAPPKGKKTLLLCFIHGFKGSEDTFGERSEFARHLEALLSAALGGRGIDVRAVTYPKYETRGDLRECVARFRDWLLERVIDAEVANGAHSPTVDPSVRVVLVGHSMGGIVAAETAISIASEKPIVSSGGGGGGDEEEGEGGGNGDEYGDAAFNGLMFPYIQGVLAFDTPYLGIAPGVVAHGAEGHYNKAAAALTQLSGLSGMLFGAGSSNQQQQQQKQPVAALPAPPPPPEEKKKDEKESPWGNWGKIAMYAGAAGAAVAAGGAAAYVNRQHIGEGWSWVGSHLEFVGCLARGEELRGRVAAMARLSHEVGVGFANLYTRLGKGAASKEISTVGLVMGNQRTFCNLPKKQQNATGVGVWKEAINDKAEDETTAHMNMFEPKENPGYTQLSEDAKNLIVEWTRNEWYQSSDHWELENHAESLI
ncbi:hypothetical protein UCREL1_11624 [Eutypa lata UCREL1]|uniref:AB hydrolase-1 domain-containing protein n=1 Tax=Eutypa lata (strain UCR-EL1) TaxID=1287681 RepID=M7SB88_EUTLA|nr:hypothetical protein UCREL1_11624 [Eutypa lata UCREL1]